MVTSASPVGASRPCLRSRRRRAPAGSALGEGDALQADAGRASFIMMNMYSGAVGFAEQVTDSAAVVAVGHDAGQAGVDAGCARAKHAVGVVARAPRRPSALNQERAPGTSRYP